MDTPQLSIIIVNWNVRELLRRALDSIYTSWGPQAGLEVIVVDNGSHDDSPAMVREAFPQVILIANRENRGFTGGNNQGLAAARGKTLLLLNPDTEILGDALHKMLDYLQAHSEVGLIGPQLLNPDGSVQSSRRHFPNLAILFLESTWLQKIAPRRMLRHYYAQEQPDSATQSVDWVTGAAMLARRTVLTEVGGLDEGFFMYSEELDWCRRIKAAGWRVDYFAQAQIVHHEGKSSEQVVAARHIYFQSSKVRYTRKHHSALSAELLRLWLMGQYCVQIGIEGIKWLWGRKRPLRAARIRAYRQVLRSGLHQNGPVGSVATQDKG